MTAPTPPDPHPQYETPGSFTDVGRPAAAAPSEEQLQSESPTGRQTRDPYAALRVPAFRLYVAAFFLSAIGAQIETTAVGYEIFHKTHSALSLGWIGLVLAIPTLLLSLPAGQLADTYSRKNLFLFMQIATTGCALGLTILSWKFDASPHQIGATYALLFLAAIGGTIGRPGREALMAGLVPGEIYPNAVTWNATCFETSSLGGPAVGGLIVAYFGPAAAYAVSAAAFAVAFLLILLMPDNRPAVSDGAPKRRAAGLADLAVGIRFVFGSQLILAALTLDLFAVLFGGATFLLPQFADEVLHVGAVGFGFLRAAPSIGAVTMAMLQAHLPPFRHAGVTLLWTVGGFGLATLVFGLSRSYTLSFIMLMLTGATDNISVVIRHSLVPLLTPDSMRGRVMAVNQIFVGSSNELGGLESGLTAAALGPQGSVILGGVLSMLVVAAVAVGFPAVRRLGSLHDVQTPPEPDEALASAPPA